MIFDMVEALRRWETHCNMCAECRAFDAAPAPAQPQATTGAMPCGIGRAIILNLIRILQRGL